MDSKWFSVLSKSTPSIMFSFLLLCCLVAAWSLSTGASIYAAEQGEQKGDIPATASGLESLPQVQSYTINIKGNSSITEKDILKAAAGELQMFEQRGYRKADIDDAAFQMRSAYLQAGHAFALVDYTYEKKGDHIEVIFDIQEGPQVIVENIVFLGNRNIPTDKLLGFFGEPAKTWGRKQQIIFVESEVRDAINMIRDHYRGEGFIDVVMEHPDLAFNANRSGVTITIPVEEGPQYIISDVQLKGDLIPALAPELDKIKNELTGKSYYVRRKLFLRTSLEDAYDAVGYAEANVAIEVVQQDEPGRIILLAVITSGEQVRIADVLISGNESTKESFIRGRLQLKPGDIYTRAKKMESFRKLYDSGLFAKISMELSGLREDGSRILEVEVEELPTREYFVEPGWGSYEQLRLRAGAFEKNLFGTGKNGRIDGLISMKGETISLSYTDPWLLQTDISMNVPLYFESRDEPSYTSDEAALSVLFSRKFSKNLTLSTGYQYKMTQLSNLADDAVLQKGEEDYNKGTVGIQAIWDSRDDIFYPAAGLRLASGFDISLPALGSEIEFGRITLGCRYFIALPREYILGLRATTGLIIPLGNQSFIPISERFFNGGDNTVRSYKHSELGPKDENNEPTGGLGYNVVSIELRKRFYKNFATTLYVDAGNVSPNKSLLENAFMPYASGSDLLDDTLNDFFSEFKYGIGIGFQYLLPVGPIRIDIAYNPDPEEIWNEDNWAFHFSLGMAF
jgi:outer membrane protein insertion porin family